MQRLSLLVLSAATLASCAPPHTASAPGRTGWYPPRDLAQLNPQTRAERTGFTETSHYADVLAFLDSLDASSDLVHLATFGRTSQGRDIPMAVLSRPAVSTAAEARALNRPIVYIQGNIHGGEVEGKEALLSLLRDLARNAYPNVIDSMVIVAVPVYNVDGNEAFGPQARNRREQNGPELVGQRANGQGLDLNRDYVKAEAPETRASLAFFREWDPDVFVDLHTTDGSYHGYALTWAPPLNPAAIFTGPFTADTILPTLQDVLNVRDHIATFPYGNFISQDSVDRGWYTYDHRPRYGTNYYGLRGRIAILSEAYSHDPFSARVASTYSFVRELLSLIAANQDDFGEAGRDADRRTTAFASTINTSPKIAIRSRLTQKPHEESMVIEEIVRTGDSTRTEPGLPRGVRRTGKTFTRTVPVYDRFDPVLERTLPYAWVIPAEQASLLPALRMHGIYVEQVAAPVVMPAEQYMIDSAMVAARPFQGHSTTSIWGEWVPQDSLTVSPGDLVVRAGQPLAILALYLLAPDSDDGLTTWNFLDSWLAPGSPYPIRRVLQRITVPLHPAPGAP